MKKKDELTKDQDCNHCVKEIIKPGIVGRFGHERGSATQSNSDLDAEFRQHAYAESVPATDSLLIGKLTALTMWMK